MAGPVTPIGRVGRILAAESLSAIGFYIEVEDDSERTGGLFIFTWLGKTGPVYDSWVEKIEDLDRYFAMRQYEVEWLTDEQGDAARRKPGESST